MNDCEKYFKWIELELSKICVFSLVLTFLISFLDVYMEEWKMLSSILRITIFLGIFLSMIIFDSENERNRNTDNVRGISASNVLFGVVLCVFCLDAAMVLTRWLIIVWYLIFEIIIMLVCICSYHLYSTDKYIPLRPVGICLWIIGCVGSFIFLLLEHKSWIFEGLFLVMMFVAVVGWGFMQTDISIEKEITESQEYTINLYSNVMMRYIIIFGIYMVVTFTIRLFFV